jgi:hypothetical protein
MRQIIVHYHIFKNAGSTVDDLLARKFPGVWGGIEGPNPWDTVSQTELLEYVLANPALRAISTHQARLPTPVHPGLQFFPLVFLRHPIDRVGSVYSFERRQPASSPGQGVQIARSQDLPGYVRWRLIEGHGAVIWNYQTVHLAGRERDMRTAHATREDFEVAKQRLSELPFFGLVETFAESLQRMRAYLEPPFGTLEGGHGVHNRSPERKATLAERIAELEAVLGPGLYQELLEKNAFDLELYEHAVRIGSAA